MDKLKKVWEIIKDNALYIGAVLLVFWVASKYVFPELSKTPTLLETNKQKKESLKTFQNKYDELKSIQEAQNREKKVIKDGKTIYEAQGMKFSPDASFAPLFEIVLTLAQQSGIRIRAIDYNYAPAGDIIYDQKIPEYNASELAIVAVGTYSQFQTFFKSILKESYVTNIAEMEITPWNKDQKILINKFKLRLYTKTAD